MVQWGLNFNPDVQNGQPGDFQAVHGVKWARQVFIADDLVRSVENAFTVYDPIVRQYNAVGVNVLFVLNHQTFHGDAPWMNGGDWATYAQEFGQLSGKIAAHYAQADVAYEIWNEPDYGSASVHVPADKFAAILKSASRAIKQVNPSICVISGGLASPAADAVQYINNVQKALGASPLPIDAIAIHPYGQWTPNFGTAPSWGGWFGRMDAYLSVIAAQMPKLPLWITEVGVSEAVPYPPEQYNMVTTYMQGVYDLVQTQYTARIPVVVWFAWSDKLRNAGIVDGNNAPKPSVYQKFFGLVDTANRAEQVQTTAQQLPAGTPYDGQIAFWYWEGSSVVEQTIDELLSNIKAKTPNVKAIFAKTNNGEQWQGYFDPSGKSDLMINSSADVARWVQKCKAAGFDFHAWCVVRGVNPTAEIALMSDVCNVTGVKSLILDVEEGQYFFQGGASVAQQIGEQVRLRIPDGFHLGLCIDSRGTHPQANYINQWLPSIDSLHPMVYYVTFGVAPDVAVQNAFKALHPYGRPIVPILEVINMEDPKEISQAVDAVSQNAPIGQPFGVSLWTYNKTLEQQTSALDAISRLQIPAVSAQSSGQSSTPVQSTFRFTNQDVINAFAAAARSINDPNYWTWVTSANLEYLASDRTRGYSGSAISALPGLNSQQKTLIQRALDGQPLDALAVSSVTVGKYSNQQIINAFYEAAINANAKDQYWNWIQSAGLAAIVQDRNGLFKGPEIDALPNLTPEQKRGILAALQPQTPAPLMTGSVCLQVPWITQLDAHGSGNDDCGQACVLMLLKYYRLVAADLRLPDIDFKVDPEKDGTTPGDLKVLASLFNLHLTIDDDFVDVDGLRLTLSNQRPAILLVNYADLHFPHHLPTDDQGFHWLIVVGCDGSQFWVHDPLWLASDRGGEGGAFLPISHDTLNHAMVKVGQRYQALY